MSYPITILQNDDRAQLSKTIFDNTKTGANQMNIQQLEEIEYNPLTPYEMDRQETALHGANKKDCAWLCTDFDSWIPNPYYTGLPMPHPEDESQYQEDFDLEAWQAQEIEWQKQRLQPAPRQPVPSAAADTFTDGIPF